MRGALRRWLEKLKASTQQGPPIDGVCNMQKGPAGSLATKRAVRTPDAKEEGVGNPQKKRTGTRTIQPHCIWQRTIPVERFGRQTPRRWGWRTPLKERAATRIETTESLYFSRGLSTKIFHQLGIFLPRKFLPGPAVHRS